MKKSIFTLALTVLVSLGAFAQSLSVDTENAKVSFNVVSEKVTGTVTGMKATINFNADDLSKSKIEGTVDVSTISTGNKMRDNHLQQEEYFNAKEYPTMKFVSEQITKTDKGYDMAGKMTIRGVTNDATISFTYSEKTFVGKTVVYTNDYDFAKQKNREDSKILVKFTVPVK